MARPYTLSQITAVPATDSTPNLLNGLQGEILPENAQVDIAMNAESVDITAQVTIGADNVYPTARVTLNAAAGVLPILPDDRIIRTFGNGGERIIIRGTNANAAPQELRVVVQITPIDDQVALQVMQQLGRIPA